MVMQVIHGLSFTESRMCRLQLYTSMGFMGPLRVASCTNHTATTVTWGRVSKVAGMHPPPGHPQKGICINISLPCPIIQLKVVICQTGNPSVTHSIQLGCCQGIGQGIIVCVDIKGQSIKVFMGFLDHGPFEGDKLQFAGRVVRFGLCQAPNDDSISTIITSLIEDSPQAIPASISIDFKRSVEISRGKNRCNGAQAF